MENYDKNWFKHFVPSLIIQGVGGVDNDDGLKVFRSQKEVEKDVVLEIFNTLNKFKADELILYEQDTKREKFHWEFVSNDYKIASESTSIVSLVVSVYQLGELTDDEEIQLRDDELLNEITKVRTDLKNIKHISLIIDRSNSDRVLKFKKFNNLLVLNEFEPKAISTLSNTLIKLIKQLTTEYYINEERSLRRNNDVNSVLRLAITNFILKNFEESLKLFELAYDLMTKPNENEESSKHDDIIDILMFQIVRACLYLNQLSTAMTKFNYHIQKNLKEDNVWLSIQFKMLAQLLELSDNISAYSYLTSNSLNKDIELLRFAKLSFQKKNLVKSLSIVNFLIGDDYYKKGDYSNAIKLFELIDAELDDYITNEINIKKLKCYEELKIKEKELIETYLELKKFSKNSKNLKLNNRIETNEFIENDLITCEVLFKKEEESMNNFIELQIEILGDHESLNELIVDFSSGLIKTIKDEKINKFNYLKVDTKELKVGNDSIISIKSKYSDSNVSFYLNIPIITNPFKVFYNWEKENFIIKRSVNNNNSNFIKIIPRIPDVELIIEPLESQQLFINELFKFKYSFKDLDFEDVKIKFKFECAINDDILKIDYDEDEILIKEKNKIFNKVIDIQLPNSIGEFKYKFTCFVNDILFKSVISTHSVINPFKLNLNIYPKHLENKSLFILDEQIIPKPKREWLLQIINQSSDDIKILEDSLIISNNPNKNITINESQTKSSLFSHILITDIIDGHSYRNVQFEAQLQIKYVKNDINQIYNHNSYKLNLPFLDPRVLLTIEKDEDNFKFNYFIENPTNKIFTFNIQLLENNHFTLIGSKKFLNLNVLPLNSHHLEFSALCNDNKNLILLPVLKVFDVNYRVNLPTLTTDDNIVNIKGDLFLKNI